jgi:hypothetical protein
MLSDDTVIERYKRALARVKGEEYAQRTQMQYRDGWFRIGYADGTTKNLRRRQMIVFADKFQQDAEDEEWLAIIQDYKRALAHAKGEKFAAETSIDHRQGLFLVANIDGTHVFYRRRKLLAVIEHLYDAEFNPHAYDEAVTRRCRRDASLRGADKDLPHIILMLACFVATLSLLSPGIGRLTVLACLALAACVRFSGNFRRR